MKANYLQRQTALRAQLTQKDLGALLVLGCENIQYLSGFSGHAAYGIVTKENAFLITDYRYVEQAKNECQGFEVICRNRETESLGTCIKRHINTAGTLGFESTFITVDMWLGITAELTGVTTKAVTGLIERQRMVKDQWEINQTKRASAISDQSLNEVMPYFQVGVTERELAIELEYRMQMLGSEGLSFDTIMLFGERSSLPHGIPGEQKLKKGDFITLDFGAVINGYRSDMTRSFIFGEATDKQIDIYTTVAEAQKAAIEILKPGLPSIDAYHAARTVLNASPYGAYAGDGLGHGVGLFLHEAPIIGPNCDYILEAGNIITIEPGIYIPDFGGVRLEDDLLITEEGYQVLTHAPKPMVI